MAQSIHTQVNFLEQSSNSTSKTETTCDGWSLAHDTACSLVGVLLLLLLVRIFTPVTVFRAALVPYVAAGPGATSKEEASVESLS